MQAAGKALAQGKFRRGRRSGFDDDRGSGSGQPVFEQELAVDFTALLQAGGDGGDVQFAIVGVDLGGQVDSASTVPSMRKARFSPPEVRSRCAIPSGASE